MQKLPRFTYIPDASVIVYNRPPNRKFSVQWRSWKDFDLQEIAGGDGCAEKKLEAIQRAAKSWLIAQIDLGNVQPPL